MSKLLDATLKSIDAKQIREYLAGDDIKRQLAHMKVDRLLKAFFDDMQVDGKDAAAALEYMEKGLAPDDRADVLYIALLKRSKEFVELISSLKKPETKLSAIKELQKRNLL